MVAKLDHIAVHTILSPSSSDRWIACPGSIQAQAEVIERHGKLDDDSNEYSRLGVAAHALLEACLALDAKPQSFLGARLAGKDHPPVNEDMCDAVQVALDYIEELIDIYGEENVEVWSEMRVPIGPQFDIPAEKCSGTSDVIITLNDRSLCIVIDYKNGVGQVHAKNNPQCMLYAAGVREFFGAYKKYRSVIIQPRAGKRSPVDEWEYSDALLRRFLREEVGPSARAALLPNAPRTAGDHCKWCKAAPECQTYRRRVRATARSEFSAVDDDEEPPNPELIQASEYPRILEEATMLENWIKAVRIHALKMVECDKDAIEGWTLGWTKRHKEWDDEQGMIEFCKRHGLKIDEYAPRELLSPAQMKKLVLHKLSGGKRRKRNEEPPPDPTEAYVTYGVPKPKLIRRGEDPASEFGEVEDESDI